MEGLNEMWQSMGGQNLVIMPNNSATASQLTRTAEIKAPQRDILRHSIAINILSEIDNKYCMWCNRIRYTATIIRPDRYVYAGIRNRMNLKSILEFLTAL